ncbi:unnamed protein product [Choristocarpus tenellus]
MQPRWTKQVSCCRLVPVTIFPVSIETSNESIKSHLGVGTYSHISCMAEASFASEFSTPTRGYAHNERVRGQPGEVHYPQSPAVEWTGDVTTKLHVSTPSSFSPYGRGGKHRRRTRTRDENVDFQHQLSLDEGELAGLRTELASARSQLDQKEVIIRSLQRQLDQREVVDSQAHARAEEDLISALARESSLREQLAEASQSLVEEAVARKKLEENCASISEHLSVAGSQKATADVELADTRAELARVLGMLQSRRGTDVVETELAFAEELRRLQEVSAQETATLRHEVSVLRAAQEEKTAAFRRASEERDAWCKEANALSLEVHSLQETISALRQYSESSTIDQLLQKVSHWKGRAEELERSGEGLVTASHPILQQAAEDENGESGAVTPYDQEGVVASIDSVTGELMSVIGQSERVSGEEGVTHTGHETDYKEIALEVARLERALAEEKEGLLMATEDRVAGLLMLRDESQRRRLAEERLWDLEAKVTAEVEATRKITKAKRAVKAKAIEELKSTIRLEMGAELERLRSELYEERQVDLTQLTEPQEALSVTTTQAQACGVGAEGKGSEGRGTDIDGGGDDCSGILEKQTQERGTEATYAAVANDLMSLVECSLSTFLEGIAVPSGVADKGAVAGGRGERGLPRASSCVASATAAKNSANDKKDLDKKFAGGTSELPCSASRCSCCPGSQNAGVEEVRASLQERVTRAMEKVRERVGPRVMVAPGMDNKVAALTWPSLTEAAGQGREGAEKTLECVVLGEQSFEVGEVGMEGSFCAADSVDDDQRTTPEVYSERKRERSGKQRVVLSKNSVGRGGGGAFTTPREGRRKCPLWGRKGEEAQCDETVVFEGCSEDTPQGMEEQEVNLTAGGRCAELDETIRIFELEKEELVKSLTMDFEREKATELDKQRFYFEYHIQELNTCIKDMVHEFGDGRFRCEDPVAQQEGESDRPAVAAAASAW